MPNFFAFAHSFHFCLPDRSDGSSCDPSGTSARAGRREGSVDHHRQSATARERGLFERLPGGPPLAHPTTSGHQEGVAVEDECGAAEREVALLRLPHHPCVIDLLYRFRLNAGDEVCECLVLDFLPTDLSKLRLSLPGRRLDPLDAKLFAWQLFAALDHVHSFGIAHCDLKPSNSIVDPHFGLLRLADFGNAKILRQGEEFSPYQVTRYYRAPELVFGATEFTLSIDRWAAGCVLAELFVGKPLLCGRDAVDQGRLIVEVLGYPSTDQIKAMRVQRPRLVRRKGRGLDHLTAGVDFPPAALEIVKALLVYEPHLRTPASLVLGHSFFDQLRQFPPPLRHNGRPIPPLHYWICEQKTQSERSAPARSPPKSPVVDQDGNSRNKWNWFW